MSTRKLAAVTVALLAFAAVGMSTSSCSVEDEDGNKYDLSSLIKTSGEDWVAKDGREENKYTYRINICHDLLYTGYNKSVTIPPGYGVHQENNAAPLRQHVLGKTTSTLVVSDGVLSMTFEDGEICDSLQRPRTAIIMFECDLTAGLGQPVFLTESDDCEYLFDWRTNAACTAEQITAGAIAAIVIFALFGVYMLFGCLFLRFVRHKKGTEQIPHYDVLVKVFSSISIGKDGQVSYRQVAHEDDDAGNLIDNLDDDYDDDAVEKA